MPVILCAVSAVHPLHEFKTGSRLGQTSLMFLPPSECSCIGEEVVGRSNYVLQVCISSGATWNQACRARAGTADCGELATQLSLTEGLRELKNCMCTCMCTADFRHAQELSMYRPHVHCVTGYTTHSYSQNACPLQTSCDPLWMWQSTLLIQPAPLPWC